MTEQQDEPAAGKPANDKCRLCGAPMLTLACPGGCFITTAHEVDGVGCKDRRIVNMTGEIDRLTSERDEVRAACAVLRGYIAGPVVYVTDAEIAARRAQRDKLLATPNSGQGVLVELDRLRRLEAALEDNSLMRLFYMDSGSADVSGLVLCSYRDALRKRAKGE